jgi:hypothetical protein
MPNQDKLVLFFRKRDDYYSHFCAYLNEDGMLIGPRDFDIYVKLEDVTHWMELPEAPQ